MRIAIRLSAIARCARYASYAPELGCAIAAERTARLANV
jgi:hypothetical protein